MAKYDETLDRSQPSRSARELPETVANEVIKDVVEDSVALRLARTFRMTAYQHRMRVLKAFADAYWLTGTDDVRGGGGSGTQKEKDSAVKGRTKVEWDNVFLTPEELAVLVPVPDAWMDDSDIAWEEIRSEIVRAFAKKIDEAIFFGAGGVPGTMGAGLVSDAKAAGNVVYKGQGAPEGNSHHEDLALDIAALGELLDSNGYMLSGFATHPGFKWRLRRLRDQDGQPILQQVDGGFALYGEPMVEVRNGAWDRSEAAMVAGEWDKLVVGVRQDITFRVFDQAVLTDPSDGKVVYNAVEQDGKVLRAVMRLGYAVPNPVKALGGQYPFAVLSDTDESSA